MGWLKETSPGNYVLGPKLRQELFTDLVPDLENMTHDLGGEHKLGNGKDKPVFLDGGSRSFDSEYHLQLAFHECRPSVWSCGGNSFANSDVAGSSVVGNEVTELLREVNFLCKREGVQYFEPLPIQYIPLSKQVLDIIETQDARDLARFGEGNTIITLHFKGTSEVVV